MSELRRDRISGAWVIIAPERRARPGKPRGSDRATAAVPGHDTHCPFCPGNERMLPGIIEQSACAHEPGWRTRVVANKYPSLSPDNGEPAPGDGAETHLPGYGFHEVIIETPRHDGDLVTLGPRELDAVMRSYRHRLAELTGRPGIRAALLFRNHGRRAGASLVHPHSQIVALAMVPPRLATIAETAHTHHQREGRCPTCEELELEIDHGRRIVENTDDFTVLVPYAAERPFELAIVPRRHCASFVGVEEGELAVLGPLLQRVLGALDAVVGDPPYNFAFESWSDSKADAACLHWRLRIAPGLVTPGGFELGSGMAVNPSSPEDDADALRGAMACD